MSNEKSNAYPRQYYGDPALVYERSEAETCRGCIHVGRAFGANYCEKSVKTYPKRCAKNYKEAE